MKLLLHTILYISVYFPCNVNRLIHSLIHLRFALGNNCAETRLDGGGLSPILRDPGGRAMQQCLCDAVDAMMSMQ